MRYFVIITTLLGGSSLAWASSLEQFGVGLAGPARGIANVAGSDDLFATFYNPAGLMEVGAIEFALVHQINPQFLNIDLDRAAGSAFEPAVPQTHQNTTLGFAVPLTGRLKGRATLGAILEVPSGVLVRTRSLDARRPHWLFYDSYPEIFVAQIAVALRVFKGFDLALGTHNNTGLSGRIDLKIDPATNTLTQRELDFGFTGKIGPTVGVRGQWRRWHVGLVYRSPLAMDYATPAHLTVEGLEAGLDLILAGVTHYLPAVLGLGVEWRHEALRLEVATQWKQWSGFPDPSIDAQIDLNGADAEQLGLAQALDAPDPDQQPRQAPGLVDVLSLGVGGAWRINSAWRTHFGYNFIPTPVPEQRYTTNLVDTNRHLFGLGVEWTVRDPSGLFAKPLKFGLTGQWNHQEARRTEKALGASDPVGSWEASGSVLSVSLGLMGTL